jgi:hypothetical protein
MLHVHHVGKLCKVSLVIGDKISGVSVILAPEFSRYCSSLQFPLWAFAVSEIPQKKNAAIRHSNAEPTVFVVFFFVLFQWYYVHHIL